tara:strand:- start:249 stop:674 length:426 start_codon:yes stop_codon:yes gene_type:complete
MAVASLLEQLLRVQAAAGQARVSLAKMTGISGVERLAQEIVDLETRLATEVARALGATPMATGGLVTMPTFALLGEAGPEMVMPVKKKKRKVSKYQKQLGKELRMLESQKRLKNGQYRSGWDRTRIMKKAHKLTRKALNMR